MLSECAQVLLENFLFFFIVISQIIVFVLKLLYLFVECNFGIFIFLQQFVVAIFKLTVDLVHLLHLDLQLVFIHFQFLYLLLAELDYSSLLLQFFLSFLERIKQIFILAV